MTVRTGKVILAKKINLDRSHNNVLSYTETQMVNLLSSNNHLVVQKTDSSFIREKNAIDIEVNFGVAIQSNYLAFQNPDYSNKWFFAFIIDIQYINNATTRIFFEVDDFATWWDYWSPNACFVIREHTNDDTIGNNLLPENVEMGPYVSSYKSTFGFGTGTYCALVVLTSPDGNTRYNASNLYGVPTAGRVIVASDAGAVALIVGEYANQGRLDSIQLAYLIPDVMVGASDIEQIPWTNNGDFLSRTTPKEITFTFDRPSTINGYTPRNKKLLTSPFQFAVMSNNNGSSNTLLYEYFSNPANCQIKSIGVPTVGCSIYAEPLNYKGQSENESESLTAGKFPTLSWSGDAFTNWLTQNSVNLSLGLIQNAVTAAAGTASLFIPGMEVAGAGMLAGTATSIASKMAQVHQHEYSPITARGNINNGDVFTANHINSFVLFKMSITSQFASRIDDYFDRLGYATNKIKIPNQTSRKYWNYVQIASSDDIGHSSQNISVPANAMENINNMYRAGITIWHEHANIGDYSLNNIIVS